MDKVEAEMARILCCNPPKTGKMAVLLAFAAGGLYTAIVAVLVLHLAGVPLPSAPQPPKQPPPPTRAFRVAACPPPVVDTVALAEICMNWHHPKTTGMLPK